MVKPRTAPFELEPLISNDKICENCAARGLSRPSDRRAASQTARFRTATTPPPRSSPPTRCTLTLRRRLLYAKRNHCSKGESGHSSIVYIPIQ